MSIRPHPTHTGWYIVDTYPEGRKGKRERLVCTTYEKACALSGALSGDTAQEITHPRLETVSEEYLEWVKLKQAAATWYDKNQRFPKFIIPLLGKYRVKDLTQRILDQYGKNLKPSMYRYDMIMLQAMIKWMVKRNLATPLTFKPEIPQFKSKIKLLPNPAEIIAAIEAVPYENIRILFKLMLLTGLRPNEARQLVWDNFRDDEIFLKSKTGEQQYIPIPPTLQPWFTINKKKAGFVFISPKLKKNHPVSNLHGILTKAALTIGLHLAPHMLRHASATFLLMETDDIYSVSKHLRHSRVTTTEIYLRYSAKRKRQSVSTLEGVFAAS